MNNRALWSKMLLWLHLFVCSIWLYLFQAVEQPPNWTIHVFLLSMLGIQFTWGLTVGLIVGPSRKRRPLLWWSLMTAFMPIWYFGIISLFIGSSMGPLGALLYLAVFMTILASETFSGVMLGVKLYGAGES